MVAPRTSACWSILRLLLLVESYKLLCQLDSFSTGEAPLVPVARLGKVAADRGYPYSTLVLFPRRTGSRTLHRLARMVELGPYDLQGFIRPAPTAAKELKQRAVVTGARLLGQLLGLLVAQAREEFLQLFLVHGHIQLIS